MRLADDVQELGHIETQPVLDGRNMTMVLAPNKTTTQQPAEAASA
jgi:translation initiation factor IF-3